MKEKLDIKYIALDMDGTLYTSEHKILENTKNALIKAQENGIEVILASGRPLEGMKAAGREIQLDKYGGLLISNNGGIVYDFKKDEIIGTKPIEKTVLKEIITKAKKYDIGMCTIVGDKLYTEDVFMGVTNRNAPVEEQFNFIQLEAEISNSLIVEIPSMLDIVDLPIVKLFFVFETEYMDKYEEEIFGEFRDFASVSRMGANHLEIVDKTVNKGVALAELGFDTNHLMTFGDSINDYYLIKHAKYGIAMANGVDQVKEVAFDVTDDNESDGIYKALIKYGVVEE